MGMSRRKFTREMKLAAIQQLNSGSSAAEEARAFEINPNLLHRWRKEFRSGPGNVFPGNGKQRWAEGRIAEHEVEAESVFGKLVARLLAVRLVRDKRVAEEDLVINEGERQVAVERHEPQGEFAHLDSHVVDVGAVEAVGNDLTDGSGIEILAS